ncbi:MAG: peptidoglycan DD-metalloendopeptidase family protein [Hydrogenophaga sp.]|uniref:peptidoglycan DD-metalloendopeptidase family protein n=1 Tax=Hydrogenophaga sp. TaxID=1904254 RepID=UPI001DB53BF6|nr:peptidoglycan DD-metalloendopeptidase family protein [Hydrogenophaga sp.]MBX3609858.1 peptidoglycan DD-metalloendopeptidase family protein [Hydrogenophaga sp.]
MNPLALHDPAEAGQQGWTAGRALTWSLLGAALLVSAGCATRVARPAPVEDRGTSRPISAAPAPGESQPKVGYITVQPGDTLYRIALNAGQDWRDVAAWNNLPNPNAIEVGQLLRVAPPNGAAVPAPAPAVAAVPNGPVTAPITSGGVTARPLTETSPVATAPAAAPSPAPAPAPAPAPVAAGDEVQFVWPASGQVIANFDENTNKGVSIAGKVGDPVVAAADGRVVYAGAGLRGYGNLIILKHNNTYLTAYAHNQALLVREDQAVRQGQKIAEMGSSDADRVKLHFEVRRLGKPVDPLSYLPKR